MPQTASPPRGAVRLTMRRVCSPNDFPAGTPAVRPQWAALGARHVRHHLAAALLSACAVVMGSDPAAAQYTPAGGGVAPTSDRKIQLETAASEARWRLGPFRIAPWFGLRNVSYQQNFLDPDDEGDLTATLGAGLRGYLHLGENAMLATYALPEYVWWNEDEDRREVIGRYGIGLFTFFNRLQVEATARRVEDLEFPSDELLVRVPQTGDMYELAAQVRLAGSIAVFGGVNEDRFRFEPFEDQEEIGDLPLFLDRNERTTRLGLRYLLPADRGHVGVGGQVEETTFESHLGPSNEGDGIYGEINLRGNKIGIYLDGALRRIEAAGGSDFPETEEVTGSAGVVLRLGWRLTPNVYWHRSLGYPINGGGPLLTDERTGVRIKIRLVRELQVQTFYEAGSIDFAQAGRRDDVESYGAAIAIPVSRIARVTVGGRRSEYDSNLVGFDRGFEEVFANFALEMGSESSSEW